MVGSTVQAEASDDVSQVGFLIWQAADGIAGQPLASTSAEEQSAWQGSESRQCSLHEVIEATNDSPSVACRWSMKRRQAAKTDQP